MLAGCVLVSAVASAWAQSVGRAQASPDRKPVVAAAGDTALDFGADLIREIEDPSSGDLWLLLRDRSRAGGPGRLVLAGQRTGVQGQRPGEPAHPGFGGARPVIHSGDAVIVEEHTPVVDARLEAIALGAAAKGACFKARLKIGGRVVRAVAVSSGHAVFAPESEVEP